MIMRSSLFTLHDEPSGVVGIDSLIASGVHQHNGNPVRPLPPEAAGDKRPTVKWIWQALTDPGRPCDSASIDYRVGLIRYLEKVMRTEFSCTTDLRQHVERYLAGHDGRRLPVPQAIKRARKKLKLTQRQLAELLCLKNHTLISKYESGKRMPSDKVFEWLRKAENVTGKELMKGNGQTPHYSVTSNGGKEASISPNLGESETSPKQQNCTSSNDDHPASAKEVL